MNKTLIPLLTTFSKVEWKLCGQFLIAFHSEDSQIVKVFIFLKRKTKKELSDLKDLSKMREEHFSHLSPTGFTKLISKLFIECERFLLIQHINENQLRRDILLNEAYNARGLFHMANRKAKKVASIVSQKETYALRDQKLLAQLFYQQCYSDNPIKYEKDIRLQQQTFQHFFQSVSIQSLIYLCEAKNWENITKEDLKQEAAILQDIIDQLPPNELNEVFRNLLKIIEELDVIAFLELRKSLYEGKFEIGDQLHTIFTIYLINACIKLWRKGTYVDANENAKLIEYGLNTNVLTSSGKIPLTRFLNLLSTLGKLKTYEWNQSFIGRWINNVDSKSTTSTHAFANALNAFNFGKYELVETFLREVEFENYSEKIRALGLEMIALYLDRKGNYYTLRNFISNYKRTLKRAKEKISSSNVKAYLNLVKVIELLVQKDFRRLTIKLDKYQPIAYRSWVTDEVGRR